MTRGDEQVLADRYRRWLRAYPRTWRERRGEELLGVLLDGAAEEGRSAPTRAEIADLVRHGLATRAGVVLPGPGARAVLASVALVTGTVSALSICTVGYSVAVSSHEVAVALSVAGYVAPATWLVAAAIAIATPAGVVRRWFAGAVVVLLAFAGYCVFLGEPGAALQPALIAVLGLVVVVGRGELAGRRAVPLASLAFAFLVWEFTRTAVVFEGHDGVLLPFLLLVPVCAVGALISLGVHRRAVADGLLLASVLGYAVVVAVQLADAWPAVRIPVPSFLLVLLGVLTARGAAGRIHDRSTPPQGEVS